MPEDLWHTFLDYTIFFFIALYQQGNQTGTIVNLI